MSSIKKLASETALYGLSSIVGRALNFLLTPVYTRLLIDTGDYGQVTELYAYAGFLMVVLCYRMETAFFRFGTQADQREQAFATAGRSVFFSVIAIAGLAMLFSPAIADGLHYSGHPEYIRYFILILTFDCLSELPFARLRLEQRPLRFVAAKLSGISLNVILNLFWLLLCPYLDEQGHQWVHQVWSPGYQVGYIFLANVLASALTFLLLSGQLIRIFKSEFNLELWKKMMRYALPLVLVGLAGIANEMLDRAILTRILPGTIAENRAQLGIYGANYKLAMLITLFTQAYRYAAEPFFFRHAAEKNALELQAQVTRWFTIVAAGAVLFILLYLDIIKYFLGVKYHDGLTVVPILLTANMLLGIYYNFSIWYRLKDRTMTGAWIALSSAILTLVLLLWWVPQYGYEGAAWATLFCYLYLSIATWFAGRKIYPVPYALGKMAFYLVTPLLLYGIAEFLRPMTQDNQILFWSIRSLLFLGFAAFVWKWEEVKSEF
jgi:O-antigen/teichoic acid export membrane protein